MGKVEKMPKRLKKSQEGKHPSKIGLRNVADTCKEKLSSFCDRTNSSRQQLLCLSASTNLPSPIAYKTICMVRVTPVFFEYSHFTVVFLVDKLEYVRVPLAT